ncbi:MAG TPA: carboxypeptidase regulatory-like domain-containing protein [Bryobacteraceae bacterium]|nr:carboxypeptidase regulatory-like domain-containing protein [Bryobacteraceae bacterium]
MRKIEQLILHSAFVLLCALLGVRAVSAQVYSGTLTGVVTDPAGAVVPGASVTLTDQNKGFKFTTKTEQDGRYVLRNLAPATYTLQAEFSGMRTYTRPDVVLTVGQNAEANITFELAGAQQRVEITATAPLVQTQDASTGQLVNQKFINDLPLTSRSVFNLTQLAPGVTQPPGGTFGLNQSAVNFVSNGGRNSTADIVMDGASQTDQENNGGITTALYTPPVDAVQEFNVQQNTYSAEIGFGGNTVINVITKSGTNQFHGSLYEFLQNSDLNANNWFNNQNRIAIAPSKRNQFGGTFGGPIRKDKTFFFVDYQGTISRNGGTARAGVPSAAERQGDFGELCARNGGVFDSTGMCSKAAGQIWDPMTSTYSSSLGGAVRSQFVPFNNLATYESRGNPNLVGTPYQLPARPGNLIDPVALKMMQYFPMPNVAVGTAAYNPLNNWIGSTLGTSSDHRFDVKVDHRLSDASLLTGRFSRAQGDSHGGNCFGNVADPCTQGPNNSYAISTSIGYNHTFSPTLILNVNYGYVRSFSFTGGVAQDFSDFSPVTTLGMPQYILTSGYVATPNITFGNGYQSVSGQNLGSQTFSILHYPLDTHDLNVSLDKIRGKHDLKFGYEGRLHIVSFLQVSYPEGQFSFSQTGTSQTPASGTGGDPLASLLIGFPQGGSGYQVDVAVTTQNFAHAWYAQDNWRVNDRLTVNLGLRYELTLPRTERYNRQSWIDPNVTSPLQVPGLPQLKGGLVFASDSDRAPYNVDPVNFGPRVGLAYRTLGNVVIRTGYGIFFDPIKGAASGTGNGGFNAFNWNTPLLTTFNNDGATPYSRISNPYPAGVQLPPGSSQGLLTRVGLGVSGPIKTWNNTPYIQTWNFGLQREFKGILIDANYVGTKGTHLYFGGAGSLNYLGPWVETLSASQITQLNSFVANPFYGLITNPASSLSTKTVQQYQLLLPYPQYTGFSGPDPPMADSIYHALQVKAEKRFSNGLQLLATYVFSKSLDNSSVACGCTTWLGGATSLQDPNRRYLERAVSQFDIPQVLQFSYTYQLPFGKGKHWGNNWNGFVDAFLGGWQTNGIWRFDDGIPIALSVSNSRPLPTYGAQRPNLIGPLTRNDGSNWLTSYFANPQNAVTPAPFTVGNAPREISTARAPGTATSALSLFKQFRLPLREGSLLEVRAEAFNALNHPQFAAPNTVVGSSAFGVVTAQANTPRQMQLAMKLYF